MSLIFLYFRILVEPRRSLGLIMSKRVWTLIVPLFLSIAFTASVSAYYVAHVDMAWLADRMTETMTREQRESLLPSITRGRLFAIALIGVVFFAIFVNLGRTLIYWIILKVRGMSQSFVKIFAIVMWSTAPIALVLVAGILNVALAPDGRIAGNDVNPVSLNQLIFHYPPNSGWGQMLSSFSLINIWEIALIAIALQMMTSIKIGKAIGLAAIPDVVVYAIWASFLLLRSA